MSGRAAGRDAVRGAPPTRSAWPSALEIASARPLPDSFFARPAPSVARGLLGAVIVSRVDGQLTAGIIVETEAYLGADDPGSHASTKGVTPRNRVMYGPPGCAYVYFTYGTHHMLNIVTDADGSAGAVLVRAIEPVAGLEIMRARRGGRSGVEVANGPGKLSEALGVDQGHNGAVLGGELMVCEGCAVDEGCVRVTGRVGLTHGHELPLRFLISDNPHVSRGRTGPRPARQGRAPRREETG